VLDFEVIYFLMDLPAVLLLGLSAIILIRRCCGGVAGDPTFFTILSGLAMMQDNRIQNVIKQDLTPFVFEEKTSHVKD